MKGLLSPFYVRMKPYRVLFVCLGNICRSPAGENVFRHFLQQEEVSGISVDSAGTAGYHIGKSPDHRMTEELEGRGVRVSGAARQFIKSDYKDYDLIIPMDKENTRNVLKLAQNTKDEKKVKPFMSFCENFTNAEVPDPYYGGQEGFAHVADLMEDGCKGILKFISD